MSIKPTKFPPLTEPQRELVVSVQKRLWQAIRGNLKSLARYYDSDEDAYQVGMLGICRAAQLFEPERGLKFWTYAWHRVRASLQGNLPTASMNVMIRHSDSFETRVSIGSFGRTSMDTDIEPYYEEREAEFRLDSRTKDEVISERIGERNLKILRLRSEGHQLHVIGGKYGISKERVRQIVESSLKKIADLAAA